MKRFRFYLKGGNSFVVRCKEITTEAGHGARFYKVSIFGSKNFEHFDTDELQAIVQIGRFRG